MVDWIKMNSKFANKCITCEEMVDVGTEILWLKGTGIKHASGCEAPKLKETDLISPQEWKDFTKYSRKELETIINCQCCGVSLDKTKDIFTNDDKRTCQRCFLK